MPFVTLSNGTRFSALQGVTLLDAASAQGIVFEHSCRTGRCGSCKARIVSGVAARMKECAALSLEEEQSGWILTCAHEAQSDVHLDIEDLNALAGISTKTLPARIDILERLSTDVMRVELRLPPNAGLRFLAGQYIDVVGPSGTKRSYSLAGDSLATGKLELHIKHVPSGVLSEYWFKNAKENDLLRLIGPRGTIFLRPHAYLDIVFLATGTGVAPIKAMLHQLSSLPQNERPSSVSLYWGGRSEPDLYWNPEQSYSGLNYFPVLSRADSAWYGLRGHVQDAFMKRGGSLTNAFVYACGSEAMVHEARQQLMRAGLPVKRFFSDAFVSSN